MKNYGSPEGIPIEQAIQAYLNDHLGEHAPRVGTETGEAIGYNITEWWPDGNVWEMVTIAADSIGHELALGWVGGQPWMILRQNRMGQDVPLEVRVIAPFDKGDGHRLVAKRTGVCYPHCGSMFQPRGDGA